MMYIYAIVAILAVVLVSCVPTPTIDPEHRERIIPGGTFVLCEGLWHQDNSALSYVDLTGHVVRDVVGSVNPGLRLGDTGSDAFTSGDSIWIAVNTSRSIELFRKSTGEWLGRVQLGSNRQPYRMVRLNDTVAYCTNLNDDSMTEFNPKNMTIRVDGIHVGPAPEGIAVDDKFVYVALSGLGDLRKHEPGSGSVVVLRQKDLGVEYTIPDLPNVAHVVCDAQTSRLWITYRKFVSVPTDTGGVVVWDTRTRQVKNAWTLYATKGIDLDVVSGHAFVLYEQGVSRLDPSTGRASQIISHASTAGNDIWYSLGYDALRSAIWIGNARSYVTDGEAIEFDSNGAERGRYGVAINPTAFIF